MAIGKIDNTISWVWKYLNRLFIHNIFGNTCNIGRAPAVDTPFCYSIKPIEELCRYTEDRSLFNERF